MKKQQSLINKNYSLDQVLIFVQTLYDIKVKTNLIIHWVQFNCKTIYFYSILTLIALIYQ